MNRPEPSEYAPYYEGYVSLVPETDILTVLRDQNDELRSLVEAMPEERGTYAYAEAKWTVKELLSHLIDGEKIFAYRALRISRGDATPIEGFDQDPYIEHSHANERSFGDLIGEFDLNRRANLVMFGNMRDPDWMRFGTASDNAVSAKAVAWIMAGHVRHHVNILKERYL